MNWHSQSIEETLAQLESDPKLGLSSKEASIRLSKFGFNALPEPKVKSVFQIFLSQFASPLIYLLLIAALIAYFIGEEYDAAVILAVVILNAIIGSIQEGRAEQSLAALRKLSKLKAHIIRDGHEQTIEASELVPGDLIMLSAGDFVSADARLLELASLAISEASLTGESVPVFKVLSELPQDTSLADRTNMVFAGTYVTAGRGLAVVVATGSNNEIGKIAHLTTQTIQPKTQLEIRIQQFGRMLVISSLVLFCLVILVGLWRNIEFSQILMIAISQMVSLVPEGLPVAMTIALAVGVQRMAKRGTIVRRLSAVETLGSTTVICSDKTGTLTQNEMTVTKIILPTGREIQVEGIGYAPEGALLAEGKIIQVNEVQPLSLACVLCNDAHLMAPNDYHKRWRIIGDPTEAALLTMAVKTGVDVEKLRVEHPRSGEIPFDSSIQMMATQHSIEDRDVVCIKGAPEKVLQLCSLSSTDKEKMKLLADQMAAQALRVLAVGQISNGIITSNGFSDFQGQVEFLGLIGQMDPPRAEVAEAVRNCQEAGIRPVMVTGDHKATGFAVAKALKISTENALAIDGRELDGFSDRELQEKIDKISVFARVRPEQKLRIVKAYQARGEVVAMTGDGVNDAPALVQANVGVAMGITGTEVAKEAAKIIITDDNFSTIVAAVGEGRLVYQNIKKLLLFLFVTSLDEVFLLFLALILGYPLPLAAVQILWINLVTEGALTINLIMEPAEGNEMKRSPIPVNEPLLDRALLSRIPLMVIASLVSTFGWFTYRFSMGIPEELLRTETFTMLAVCQWFNVLNCRSDLKSVFSMDLLKNPWLLGGLLLANGLHILVVYWPPLGNLFHTVPIDVEHFFAIGGVASLVLVVEEIRKFFARRKLAQTSIVA